MTILRHEDETRTQELCVTLRLLLQGQEGEPKLTWRNSGWMGIVSSIVIGGGESPIHGEGLDGST